MLQDLFTTKHFLANLPSDFIISAPYTIGSDVHDRVVKALTEKSIVNGIKKASPIAQTSCLESFHSVVNHFCPKMIGYSYTGMHIRWVSVETIFFLHNF